MATALVDLTELSRPTKGQAYFNPRPSALKLEYGGCAYTFQKGYGEIALKYSTQNSPVYKTTGEAHTSANVFKHFFGDDGRTGRAGECGIRPLFGDHRDESIVLEAEDAFREAQYAADMRIKMAHMARVANERQAGAPPTAPSKDVQEAMARIAERDRLNGWSAAFACPHCASPNSDAASRDNHVAAIHPELADAKATPQFETKTDQVKELETVVAEQRKFMAQQAEALASLQAVVAEVAARKKPGPKPKVKTED
jgi:hypothetical protein